MPTTTQIESLLPQTQCRQCGYDGCAPYAAALAAGTSAINLCPPGGVAVMHDLAVLLDTLPIPLAQADQAAAPKALAQIDEAKCIGCAACIKACPVDAIMGATKQMHTVLTDECTGCALCLPPCPVDCIDLVPTRHAWLPHVPHPASAGMSERAAAAAHARMRYRRRNTRLQRLADERCAHLGARATVNTTDTGTGNSVPNQASNQAGLIAQAMARARKQQNQRSMPANHADFARQQITKAQERARLRRAQRDLQYGSEAEKSAALAYLQARKTDQETKPKQD